MWLWRQLGYKSSCFHDDKEGGAGKEGGAQLGRS